MDDPATLIAKLKMDIEALSDATPRKSHEARTPNGTAHTVITNGFIYPQEGSIPPAPGRLDDMCADSLRIAKILRRAVPDVAVLWWRIDPEFEDGRLYLRFCFEAI